MLILLKCIIVSYSNGNESFTGRLFSNYGPLNMLFHFFQYLIFYSVFHGTFFKKVMNKLSFFSSNFKNTFQDVVYYRRLTYLPQYWNVILKCRPFEYEVKSWKICPFLGLFFQYKKMLSFWIISIKHFGNDFSYMGILLSKLRDVELESRTESRLLIANWYIF